MADDSKNESKEDLKNKVKELYKVYKEIRSKENVCRRV